MLYDPRTEQQFRRIQRQIAIRAAVRVAARFATRRIWWLRLLELAWNFYDGPVRGVNRAPGYITTVKCKSGVGAVTIQETGNTCSSSRNAPKGSGQATLTGSAGQAWRNGTPDRVWLWDVQNHPVFQTQEQWTLAEGLAKTLGGNVIGFAQYPLPELLPELLPVTPTRIRTVIGTNPLVPAPARRRILPSRPVRTDPLADPAEDPAYPWPGRPATRPRVPGFWEITIPTPRPPQLGVGTPLAPPRDVTKQPEAVLKPVTRTKPWMDFDYRPPAPPRNRTRERKLMNRSAAFRVLLFQALNNVSEWAEIIDAIWDALPDDVKEKMPKRGLLDNAGQYGIDGADWKMKQIYKHHDQIDWNKAFANIIANQLEDKIIGFVEGRVSKVYKGPSNPLGSAFQQRISKEIDQAKDKALREEYVALLDRRAATAARSARAKYNQVRARAYDWSRPRG